MPYLYLLLNTFTLLGPLILSFDKKVAFYKKWKSLLPAIFFMSSFFIVWDIWFTDQGVWGFNPDYLSGIYIANLPIEEWLFFITVPYACVFIYECVKAYFTQISFSSIASSIIMFISGSLIVLGAFSLSQLYTSFTFITCGIYLIINLFILKPKYLDTFLVSYGIAVFPFLLVNGILTGTGIENQVVWYNSAEIFNIRIGTIPVEDTVYNLLMLLMTINIFEYFNHKFSKSQTKSSVKK